MTSSATTPDAVFSNNTSLLAVFLREWRWWLLGAVFSFFLASVLMSGWPAGLIPNLEYPYLYRIGDALGYGWEIQRVIEGWIFDNPRNGYPFGSNFLDYPASDSANLLLLKLLGLLSGSYYAAFNLYFLLSFSAIFISTFCVSHALGLSRIFASCTALLFAFLPFHFYRLSHLFYTWYFVVPLFYYIAFRLVFNEHHRFLDKPSPLKILCLAIGLIILASFGVYYAFFGIIVIATAGMAVWVRSGKIRSTLATLMIILMIMIGVLVNIGPNLLHRQLNGPNPEVLSLTRPPNGAEIYSFRLTQLLLPNPDHRNKYMHHLSNLYAQNYPLINENHYSALGTVGAMGFAFLGLILLRRLAGGPGALDQRIDFLALIVLVLFLFGTMGGLGAIFSAAISSLIRGWNRISIFIAFGALTAFFLISQIYIKCFVSAQKVTSMLVLFAVFFGLLGLYDQTPPVNAERNRLTKEAFILDRDFVQQIEQSLPPGSAIYQLPYLPFPEPRAVPHKLGHHDLIAPFLHSTLLHWNQGGMKGRPGDLFYRSLAEEPIEKQLAIIKRSGFAGIYIDRRGFEDNGDQLIEQFTKKLGPPTVIRGDGEVVFFKLALSTPVDPKSLTDILMRQKSEYNKLQREWGINFRDPNWPSFIKSVSGLSVREPWGRWSDANLSPSVRFNFNAPLPHKFTLVLSIRAFGPNAGQDFTITVGSQKYHVPVKSGTNEIRVPIELLEKADFLEFTPPHPTSPLELGRGTDSRKLGIGFIRLRFEN